MIAENGERFLPEELCYTDCAKTPRLVLYNRFEHDLLMLLGGVPYFQASAVMNIAARDDLALVTLPAYSPDMSLVETC
jgi:hypothetical protein